MTNNSEKLTWGSGREVGGMSRWLGHGWWHLLQEKQLPPFVLSFIWAPISQTWCSIWLLYVIGSFKISSDRQYNGSWTSWCPLLYLQVAWRTCEISMYSATGLFLYFVRSNNLILGSHWNEDHRCRGKNKKKMSRRHQWRWQTWEIPILENKWGYWKGNWW